MQIDDKRFYALAKILPNINEFPDEITREDIEKDYNGYYMFNPQTNHITTKTGDDWMYRDYQKVSLITTSIERRVRYALKVVDEAIRQVTLKQ